VRWLSIATATGQQNVGVATRYVFSCQPPAASLQSALRIQIFQYRENIPKIVMNRAFTEHA
jgi:hypothetical protein